MSLGRILLLAVSVLVLFGVGQRVLDKMRLTDRQALFFMALILVGGWIPSIPLSGSVRVNIGGALVPLGLCIYLFVRAGTARERWRAGIASRCRPRPCSAWACSCRTSRRPCPLTSTTPTACSPGPSPTRSAAAGSPRSSRA